jgi:hypothetical protein
MRTPKQWVFCRFTGREEPPRYAWLVDRLISLNRRGAELKPDVFLWHAAQIYGKHLLLLGRDDRVGYLIKRDKHNLLERVSRRRARRGSAMELDRLLRVARAGSASEWQTAWLGVSGTTRGLVWKPSIVEQAIDGVTTRFYQPTDIVISVPQLRTSMPQAADVVTSIETALKKLEAIPAAERRRRKADALHDDFRKAVQVAFYDLTGNKRGAEALYRRIVEHWR